MSIGFDDSETVVFCDVRPFRGQFIHLTSPTTPCVISPSPFHFWQTAVCSILNVSALLLHVIAHPETSHEIRSGPRGNLSAKICTIYGCKGSTIAARYKWYLAPCLGTHWCRRIHFSERESERLRHDQEKDVVMKSVPSIARRRLTS